MVAQRPAGRHGLVVPVVRGMDRTSGVELAVDDGVLRAEAGMVGRTRVLDERVAVDLAGAQLRRSTAR